MERYTDTTALLNRLLEAERAGVKVLAGITGGLENGPLRTLLEKFLVDEGMNCQILIAMVKHLHGTPSRETGDFAEKFHGLKNINEKLELLIRGQEWVAKQIRRHRQLLQPGSLDLFMESIKVQHEENVDAVRSFIGV